MGAERAWHSSQFQTVDNGVIGYADFNIDKPAENILTPKKRKPADTYLPERVGIVPPRGINKKNRRKRAKMAANAMASLRS